MYRECLYISCSASCTTARGALRRHHEPGRLRGCVPPQVHQGPVRPLRADFGDDLTNSEDIFIGFALKSEGYRNVQLIDVNARSEEPEVQRLPRQVYLWSCSFLQSCYYFDA